MFAKMEQPFYHDDSFIPSFSHQDASLHDYKFLKHQHHQQQQHLNLHTSEPYRNLKTQQLRFEPELNIYPTAVQDMGSMKLASPELERLIIQASSSNGGCGMLTTPTPEATPTQGTYFYGVTEEQEGFADGFVKALDQLHELGHAPMPPPPTCSAPVYATLSPPSYPTATISYLPQHQHHSHQPHPKEEPQTVPELLLFHHSSADCSSSSSSPPVSPVNLEAQERMKAERKRQRNRVAATRCRRRKLERIARLEDRVRTLRADNAGLGGTARTLREQVARLRRNVMTHMSSGCQLALSSKVDSF